MKTNKQFIDEIYQKYDEHMMEKQKEKQRNIKKIINIAAIFIVIFSSLIVFSERQIPKQVQNLAENTEHSEDEISLNTVGDFENFYNVIKSRYVSNGYQELDVSNAMTEGPESDSKKTEFADSTRSSTNTQVENVDESDIVKVDERYIYYITGRKLVIIDARKSSKFRENCRNKL